MSLVGETTRQRRTARARTMRAAVYEDYGDADVLKVVDEHPVPELDDDEVLIKVHVSSVNPIDYRLRSGEMKALIVGGFPRVPGFDVAGEVIQAPVGSRFSVGDRVAAFLDNMRGGAAAEFAVCSASAMAHLPPDMSMVHAAAIPLAGTTALQSLRDHGRLQPGQRVLINGASGGVGAFAIQVARNLNGVVDAVASGDNREFCLELGAQSFIDYNEVDVTELDAEWDLIFDAAGTLSYLGVREQLTSEGRFVSTEPGIGGVVMSLVTSLLSKSGRVMLAQPDADDLQTLLKMYDSGDLLVHIDSQYGLTEIRDAHRRVETGVDRGKVVVRSDG